MATEPGRACLVMLMTSPSSVCLSCLPVSQPGCGSTKEGSRRKGEGLGPQGLQSCSLNTTRSAFISETLPNRTVFKAQNHSDQLPSQLESILRHLKQSECFHLTLNYLKTTCGRVLTPTSRINILLLMTWL